MGFGRISYIAQLPVSLLAILEWDGPNLLEHTAIDGIH